MSSQEERRLAWESSLFFSCLSFWSTRWDFSGLSQNPSEALSASRKSTSWAALSRFRAFSSSSSWGRRLLSLTLYSSNCSMDQITRIPEN